jgi:membrane protein implicated in regulation of membrane protease activity
MGKRERLFLWLVLILAASLVLAVLSWIADELGWGVGGGSIGVPDTVLTVALITILASSALLVIIGPSVFRRRLTPPSESTIKRR